MDNNKNCDTCKFFKNSRDSSPCFFCVLSNEWKSKEPTDAMKYQWIIQKKEYEMNKAIKFMTKKYKLHCFGCGYSFHSKNDVYRFEGKPYCLECIGNHY